MDSQLPALERLPHDWPEMTARQIQNAVFDDSNIVQLLDVKELKELPLPKWFTLVVEVFATGSSRISNYSGQLEPTDSARTDQVSRVFEVEPQLEYRPGELSPSMYVAKWFGEMTKDELLVKLEQLGDLAIQDNSGRPITRMHQVREATRYNYWKNCVWFIVTIQLADVLQFGGREWYNRFLYHVRRDKHVWLLPIIEVGYAAYKTHTEPSSSTA